MLNRTGAEAPREGQNPFREMAARSARKHVFREPVAGEAATSCLDDTRSPPSGQKEPLLLLLFFLPSGDTVPIRSSHLPVRNTSLLSLSSGERAEEGSNQPVHAY